VVRVAARRMDSGPVLSFLPLLACPECRGDLMESDRGLRCGSCRAEFAFVDGFFDLVPRDIRARMAACRDPEWSRWSEAVRSLAAWRVRRRARARGGVLPSDGTRENLTREMLERVCVPGKIALDVGAASGGKSALLPPGSRYLDLEPYPVTPVQLAPGAAMVRAVGERLPVRDAVIDTVVSLAALDCHADAASSIAEWARVLRSKGSVAILLSVMPPRVARACNADGRLRRFLLSLGALPDVGPIGVAALMSRSISNSERLKAHDYAFGELERLLEPHFDIDWRYEEHRAASTILYLTARKR